MPHLRLLAVLPLAGALALVPVSLNSSPPASAAASMAAAADAFLAALDEEQRSKATFAFDDERRFEFHYTPRVRAGLTLKAMTGAQRDRAHALLKTGLSMRGYTAVTTIIELETVLRELERARTGGPERDPGLYYVSIFGTPGRSPWGWKFEGHHISLNFTIAEHAPVVFAPSFFGANPAIVRDGPKKGTRALAPEEEAARGLLASLDETMRARAIFDVTAPRDIITAEGRGSKPLPPGGIAAREMTSAQRRLLEKLIDVYLGRVSPALAEARLEALQKAGLDEVTFGWAGRTTPGQPHYYRVQGPTFLIEYDNVQDEANHIHSVWRDFGRDFGRDLLAEHYREYPH